MNVHTDLPAAEDQTTPELKTPSATLSPQAMTSVPPKMASPAGTQTPPPARVISPPSAATPVVDPLLFIHATAHNDLERQRIASENRLRILTTNEPDEDGVFRGFGLDVSHPDVARLAGITDALAKLEHDAELGLKRSLRHSAIYPWVKAQVGLGEKQAARLLSSIGDPYWHGAEDRPRTVSELWAYSGLHVLPAGQASRATQRSTAGGEPFSDPGHDAADAHRTPAGVAAKRRKGQRCNWSTDAKTRAYLCAVSCLKQLRKKSCRVDDTIKHVEGCTCSPFRITYDDRRARTAETHPEWPAGHSHNDALRIASKEILKHLWREARRLHEEGNP